MVSAGTPAAGGAARRIRVGVLAGGASAERQISLATGAQIALHLPADRYEAVLIDPLALMADNAQIPAQMRELARREVSGAGAVAPLGERDSALPEAMREAIGGAARALVPATEAFGLGGAWRMDVAFIALHGPWGEDGRIQGLLETLGIPHTGSGVLASALAMDKAMAKVVLAAAGLRVPRGFELGRSEFAAGGWAERARELGSCLVVKPVSQGSAIGMSIVEEEGALADAIEAAFALDDRVLVEERVVGTEITGAVIGNREPAALPLVEIVPRSGVNDYRAKYDPAASDELCPARLAPAVATAAQDAAVRAHRALGCRGISRTDMIIAGGQPVILEVNALPGLTSSSLLPKAAAAAGIAFPELLDRLVRWALEDR